MTPPPRTPARETHDAVVDLLSPHEPGGAAYALIKLTYAIDVDDGACRLAEPEVLRGDLRREDLEPRIPADTDFWPVKEATDVVVLGSAYGRRSGVCERVVSVTVGEACKRVAVFGRRAVTWGSDGRPRVEAPEPLCEVPLTREQAYGGLDWRVRPEDPDDRLTRARLMTDHPGLYPRNPFGKGYLVEPGQVPELLMPSLEDPDDLLTADRLIVGDPRLWYRQPLPFSLDWFHPACFPRNVFFAADADAWYPAPEDDALPEVRRGLLPSGFRAAMEARALVEGPHPRFVQGASHGLTFAHLGEGTPVTLVGMHPERERVTFAVPAPPAVRMGVDGDWQAVPTRLHHLVVRPAEGRVNLVYGVLRALNRPFVPGIHKRIPVAVSVSGEAPVSYETPPTIKEQIARGKERMGAGGDR